MTSKLAELQKLVMQSVTTSMQIQAWYDEFVEKYCGNEERKEFDQNTVLKPVLSRCGFTLYAREEVSETEETTQENVKNDLKVKALQFTNKEIKAMPSLKDCSIRQHNGVYEIRYRKNKISKSFSHKTLECAKKKAREFLADLNNTIDFAINGNRKNDVNTAAFMEYWLNNYKSQMVKKDSLKALKSIYTNHIKERVSPYTLRDLPVRVIQSIFDNVSTKTAEGVKTIFNGVYEYAIASGIVDRSPMAIIIIKKHVRENGMRLTQEEEKHLLAAVCNSEMELTTKLYLYTGARPSELKNITFNWEENTFTLKNAKLKAYQKELTRTLPIFPTLQKLKNLIATGEIIDLTAYGRKLREILPEHTTKSLRHTFTSKCKEQGVPSELVNYWTGHTIGKDTAAKVYTHFDMKYQQQEAQKVTY